jgi:hypothetical protein
VPASVPSSSKAYDVSRWTTVKKSSQFVVVGVPRSGTSLVAGILESLGVDMGSPPPAFKGQWPRSWSNPTGYIEDSSFLKLNKLLMGQSANRVSAHLLIHPSENEIREFRERLEFIISTKRGDWGWKDPWTLVTLRHYLPYLANPKLLFCYRDLSDVRRSLKEQARTYSNVLQLLPDLDREMRTLELETRQFPQLHLDYESLIRNPDEWIARIVRWGDLETTPELLAAARSLVLPSTELRVAKRRAAYMSLTGFSTFKLSSFFALLTAGSSIEKSQTLRILPLNILHALVAMVQPSDSLGASQRADLHREQDAGPGRT